MSEVQNTPTVTEPVVSFIYEQKKKKVLVLSLLLIFFLSFFFNGIRLVMCMTDLYREVFAVSVFQNMSLIKNMYLIMMGGKQQNDPVMKEGQEGLK